MRLRVRLRVRVRVRVLMAQTRRFREVTAFRARRASQRWDAPSHEAAPVDAKEAAKASNPTPLPGTRPTRHSEATLRELLPALSKRMSASRRRALVQTLCDGLHVWQPDEWDPEWRSAARQPQVQRLIAEAAGLAAPDFKAGVHIPREAGEQLAALEWPRDRTDFLAFVMPGFCHVVAAVAFVLAQAARPQEAWIILISVRHASVLSLSSATLVDFNAAAMCQAHDRSEVDAITYLQQLILSDEQWALYPSLDLYYTMLRPSILHTRQIPAWAQPNGCDRTTFDRLRGSGELDDAFARGEQMLIAASTPRG